jgi:uncharacterized membrane protein YfcA
VIELSVPAYAGMAVAVLVAYTVFGLTGFGSAMVAVSALVQVVPLAFAVPLVLLLDVASTLALGSRNWRRVSMPEFLRLLPWMALGMLVGVGALTGLPTRPLLLMLGCFVLANVAWNLWGANQRTTIATAWALPAGLVGGVFSALFGTGGPIYTLYLARRLDDMAQFRATIAIVIMLSALMRLALFAGAGLYRQPGLLLSALYLLPFCAAGVYLGHQLHGRLPAARVRQAVYGALAIGGVAVIVRALGD